ncbi:MAG TPA: DUF2127 domain-containing protein, partial [Pirellulales bacterium]|nr:DUF2127 domain-containing protein [Pirellulales bacterium]
DKILLAIALLKYVKSVFLLCIALGALRLLHHEFSVQTLEWIKHVAAEPQHHVLRELLSRVLNIDDRYLRAISAASFLYAALLAIEGTGLWLERRWGEYFTIIITGSFIPMELYELARHPGLLRFTVTAVNVAAVAYLVVRVRRQQCAANRAAMPTD